MDFSIVYQKIKEYDKIFIFGHKRPDGDCYGSLNGLKDIIVTTFPKKRVFCLTENVEFLSFVGKMDIVNNEEFEGGLAIVCDTSTRERISDQRYKLCKEIIKIDHHLIIDNYGNYNIVDEDIAATSLLICKMFIHNKEFKISKVGANALYTGTVTDTGNFRFRGVNLETFKLAGALVELGADVEWIDKNLSAESLRSTRLKSVVYKTLKVTPNGFVYAKIRKSQLRKYNVSYDEAASFVNLLANIKECYVWALFIEYPKEIRIRLRSNGPDINKLAEKYGGGGHQKAAGASAKNWFKINSFIKDANNLAGEYKESIEYIK